MYVADDANSYVFVSFGFLSILTIIVNKYVLSVLNFTYPTIFQGWQTMFGAILLNGASYFKVVNIQLLPPTRREIALWLPAMLCFVIMIYSGSVALTNMSVPVFLASSNMLAVLQYTKKDSSVLKKESLIYSYVCSMILIGSVIGISLSDPQFRRQGYTWLCIHILSSGVLEVYSRNIQERLSLSAFQCLNMNYIYSVIILAPSSYFLGDALEARKFPYLYFTKFYIGCIISGVSGVCLNVASMTLNNKQLTSHLNLDTISLLSKVLTMAVSLVLFPIHLTLPHVTWIGVNFLSSFVRSYHVHKTIISDTTHHIEASTDT